MSRAASRDPRINPMAGDEIRQSRGRGLIIVVTSVGHDRVAWVERTKAGAYRRDNEWTLRGWREVIAKDAEVVEVFVPEPNPRSRSQEQEREE